MMYQQQRAPMEGVANQMAKHGRYGDSMLVHMNPIEVQGIASLSPTGQLTRNPVTGQPEAFLPFLAPLLGSLAGSSLLAGTALPAVLGGGALSSAAAGAIGSGLATTLATGDLKQGILSGLTGYGLGSALGGAADATNPAIAGSEEALANVGKEIGTTTADLARSQAGLDVAINNAAQAGEAFSPVGGTVPQAPFGGSAMMSPAQVSLTPAQAAVENAGQMVGQQQSALSGLQAQQGALQGNIDAARQAMTPMDRLSAPFQQPGAFGSAMMKSSTLVPIALGEGKREELRVQDEMDAMGRQENKRKQEELDRALGYMGSSYRQLESDYPGYKIPGYAGGGITSVNPRNYMENIQGLQRLAGGGTTNYSPVINPSDAAQRQSNIRGSKTISPEELQGYRPGFSPEIKYFKDEDQGYPQADDAVMSDAGAGGTPPLSTSQQQAINMALGNKGGIGVGGPNFDAMSYNYATGEPLSGMNAGSAFTAAGMGIPSYISEIEKNPAFNKTSGLSGMFLGGLKDKAIKEAQNYYGDPDFSKMAYSKYSTKGMQEGGEVEVDIQVGQEMPDESMNETLESNGSRLIEMAAMALLGQLPEEESKVVIQQFVNEFGEDALQMLRDRVLKERMPNAQTEGKINGNGKGMDDMVPGMIGDQQPVAVSPGEYIVPADVVSGLGDGDTDAGATELDMMMERVRKERTGTDQQPAPLNTQKVMPV